MSDPEEFKLSSGKTITAVRRRSTMALKELKFLNKFFDFKVKFMGVKPGNGPDSKKDLNER